MQYHSIAFLSMMLLWCISDWLHLLSTVTKSRPNLQTTHFPIHWLYFLVHYTNKLFTRTLNQDKLSNGIWWKDCSLFHLSDRRGWKLRGMLNCSLKFILPICFTSKHSQIGHKSKTCPGSHDTLFSGGLLKT